MRTFEPFTWKDTNLKVCCERFDLVTRAIVQQRTELEQYIVSHPQFRTALTPVDLHDHAPEVARRMASAAALTGLGPMASVAGTLAQVGVEAAMAAGCVEAIVENGGDMFVLSGAPVTVGIYAGRDLVGANLAFRLQPAELPLALCSSSSTMGHSLSFGDCELVTVIAGEAALADSAATLACNRIRREEDLEAVLNEVGGIPDIQGILAVKHGKIGLWGKLPEIVRNRDEATGEKVTLDRRSDGL